MWKRAGKWEIDKQLDYLKAYIRPFTIKIKKKLRIQIG
jgi:hypothetical protein